MWPPNDDNDMLIYWQANFLMIAFFMDMKQIAKQEDQISTYTMYLLKIQKVKPQIIAIM